MCGFGSFIKHDYLCFMRKIFFILLIITAFTPLKNFAQSRSDYYNLMGQADKAAKEGKWAEAEELLREALRMEPDNPSNVLLISNMGMIQFYDGRTDEALSTLTNALKIAPNSVTILLNRARVLTAAGRDLSAEEDYNRAIALDSTLIEPRFYRAMIALNRGDRQRAIADIDTLVTRHPDDRLTNVAQATILLQSGQWEEAIPYLSNAIRQQPDAAYYASRALCRIMTNDLSAAADDIALGLELDPIDGELYLYRAMLNKLRFRPADAKSDGEKAIQFGIDPSRVKALVE